MRGTRARHDQTALVLVKNRDKAGEIKTFLIAHAGWKTGIEPLWHEFTFLAHDRTRVFASMSQGTGNLSPIGLSAL